MTENYILENDKKIYPVYNESNFLINKDEIEKILKQNGINMGIFNLNIWQKAFIHKSMSKSSDFTKNRKYFGNMDSLKESDDILELQEDSSEVLEWLGDGFIQSIIAYYLYIRFPNHHEGFLTKIRSRLVKTETLSKLALALNFDKYIVISKHVEVICNGRKNAKLLEDCFEAFLGAMIHDFSENIGMGMAYELVKKFLIHVIESYIDITELIIRDDNYKDQLMRYFQKEFDGKLPVYEHVGVENNISSIGVTNRKFHTHVKDLDGNIVGEGIAKAKRESEQKAAENALKHYGVF
jgi:ribonuclease III